MVSVVAIGEGRESVKGHTGSSMARLASGIRVHHTDLLPLTRTQSQNPARLGNAVF